MKLNCKVGDLCIVVKDSLGKDLGKIVEVVSFGDNWSDEGDDRFHWRCSTLGQRFTCTYPLGDTTDGQELVDIPDACLRPIRDTDGEDETLSWLPSPTKEIV